MWFVDYAPIEDCQNEDTYGEVCVQCNKCGRFDKVGSDTE